jgi:outer membrane protein insertion porin family
MRTVYRDRGWLDAVVELDRLDFNKDRDRVKVYISVDEGARYTVSAVQVEAVRWTDPNNPRDERVEPAELLFPSEELLALCDLKPGVAFEATRLRHDETVLREHYGNQGYISHPTLPRKANWRFLEPLFLYDVEKHTVAVTYRIAQGARLRIREVFFSGTEHTRDEVTRRELSVHPGDLANLKEIQRSLARIQGTGYFSDPRDVDHRDPYYRFVQVPEAEIPKSSEYGDEAEWIDLEFIVEEGRVLDFNLSGGIDTNSGLFGIIGLTMRNFDISRPASSLWALPGELYRREAFHGAGQRLDIELSPGTDVRRLRMRFLEPDVFNLHRNPISVEIDLQARDRQFDSHDEERTTERLRFGRRFSHSFSGFLGFQLAQIDIDDLDSSGVPPQLADQEAMGRSDLNGFLLDFVHRNVDNFLTPHEGIRFSSNNSLFTEIISGDYEFFSTQQLLNIYRPFTYTKAGIPRVVHLEVNGGVSVPYGSTDDIPYSERFFLGGTSSLRGFDFRGVGPIDEASGFALGGESYIAGTVEFQFPLGTRTQRGTYREVETFRGQVFFDYGVLDPEGEFPELGELRASVGFGFGLGAPFPLAFNFGFPVIKDKLDETRTFSFTLGFN